MIRTGHTARLLAGALLVGCCVACFVDEGANTAGAGDTGTSTTGATTGATTGTPAGTGGTDSDGVTSGPTAGTGDSQTESCGFICSSTGEPDGNCDPFAQDCPAGQKCAPYSSEGDATWDAVMCVPVNGVGKPGDPCNSKQASSGLDDCQAGAFCWDPYHVDIGVCVSLCTGSHAAPTCPVDSAARCAVFYANALELCLPSCDPLIQDCAGEDLCIFMSDNFVCVYDASGANSGMIFDPCERINGCDRGLLCLNSPLGTECDQNATGCCLLLCSLAEETMCPGAGQSCVPFYAEGMAPPGNEDVGACILPP